MRTNKRLSVYLRTLIFCVWCSLVAQMINSMPAMRETQVQSLGQGDLLKNGMATHSGILAWEIPWTEAHGRLQSTGSRRAGQD